MTLLANTFFIARKARREKTALFSSGLKLALTSALPAVLAAAAITVPLLAIGGYGKPSIIVVSQWVLFYGLALLATSTFAPSSLVILGWAFLLSGLALESLLAFPLIASLTQPAATIMGVTFGFYHLLYAVLTWPRASTHE
jgi:hypothetical protein